MSALTKVFVVLHVVVSLLLVAGLVVFVNKVEDFSKQAKQYKAAADMSNQALEAIETKDVQVKADADAAEVAATTRSNALAAANQTLQNNIAVLQTSVTTATAAKAIVDTQVTTLTHALDQAQAANKAQADVDVALRTRVEDIEKKYNESQIALSDLNNRIDSTNRELMYSKEQVTALETELANARQRLVNLPVRALAPGAPAGPSSAGPGASLPPVPSNVTIRGVVKNKFQVGDVSYATVSVGSADSVSKGARFNVTDPSGQRFLGYLTIDSVDPNEASGHLNGPNVQAVQKGSTVVSNWQ